jgi:Protein of unknown function (DUF3667)
MSSTAPAESAAPTAIITATPPDAATDAAAVTTAARPAAVTATLCANCGTPLNGKYCSACGQRHHDLPIHHFWHFVGEAAEDLTHADSRLWQTLIALLFRPGFLTREFLDGRRARYLPPVRLYLVVSVIFFVIAGLHARLSNPEAIVVTQNGNLHSRGNFHYQVVPLQTQARPGAVAHARAGAASGAASGADSALATLTQTQAGRQQLCNESGTYIEQHWGWLARWGPRVTQSCLAANTQGGIERLEEAFAHNLERAMFLLLPLLALAMKPLYLRPPRHYVEHLLFFLHSHAFLFVVCGAATVLGMITSAGLLLGPIDAAIAIYIPIYYYRAMRRIYGQGGGLTLSKLAVLGIVYFFLGVLMFVATFSFSFLTL